MAKCEVTTVKREVLTTVEDKTYVLTLTQEEAELVKSFLGICAGSYMPISNVFGALYNADVDSREILIQSDKSGTRDGVLSYLYVKGLGEVKE